MTLVVALLLFAGAGLALAWAEDRLHRHAPSPLAVAWIDHFVLPLGRVFALVLFIAAAYPALYAVPGAPALGQVLFNGEHRFGHLVNLLFLAGLALPWLPGVHRVPGLTLPLQGMAGVALVFAWLAGELGRDAWLLPQGRQWLQLLALATLASGIAHLCARRITDPVARQDLRDLLLLWLQAPVLIAYGRMLGARLAVGF